MSSEKKERSFVIDAIILCVITSDKFRNQSITADIFCLNLGKNILIFVKIIF